MFPYPYPDLDNELPEEAQAGDRPVIVNVGNGAAAHPPRRRPKQKPSLTPANLMLISCGGALVVACTAWHFSGQHHRQQMAEQQQQHQAAIEQIERQHESERAKLRTVEAVVCSP